MRQKLAIISLLLLAAVVRIVFLITHPAKWWNNDSHYYFEQAEKLLAGTWVNFFPNGYPALIALLSLVLGGNRDWVVASLLALNVALACGSVWLVFLIARRIVGGLSSAFVAALLCALWPNQVNYSAQLMTEVSSTFLLLLGAYLLLCGKAISGGAVLGAMIFVRSSLAPLAVLLPLLWFWGGNNRRLILSVGVAIVLGLILPFGASRIFFEVTGKGHTGINFLIAAQTEGGALRVPPGVELGTVSTSEGVREYLSVLREEPLRFLRQRALAFWELWGPWPSREVWVSPVTGNVYSRSVLESALIGLRFPLFLAGVFAMVFYRGRWDVWFCATPVIYITLLHVVFYGLPRYTFPAEPFLFLLAAMLLQGCLKILPRKCFNNSR